MNNKANADIKLAYQTAAELTHIIALALSQAKSDEAVEEIINQLVGDID